MDSNGIALAIRRAFFDVLFSSFSAFYLGKHIADTGRCYIDMTGWRVVCSIHSAILCNNAFWDIARGEDHQSRGAGPGSVTSAVSRP
jgi:hypothetical protein